MAVLREIFPFALSIILILVGFNVGQHLPPEGLIGTTVFFGALIGITINGLLARQNAPPVTRDYVFVAGLVMTVVMLWASWLLIPHP